MTILRNILITVAGLLLVAAIIGLLLPPRVHVQRTILIDTPPNRVFRMINDLHEFNRWSPWALLDPDTRYTFEGAPSGVGSKMTWRSEHPSVGSGSLEIIESKPNRLIRNRLDFGPQGQATAYFLLEPEGASTRVTWGFDTEFGYDLLGRYFGLFFDGMIGPDYEQGLLRLKAVAEKRLR